MSKRYREALDEVETDANAMVPRTFRWRGRRYRIERVIGHWREDAGWWRRPDGEPVRITQSDLWRVEARNGARESRGVYELVHREDEWRLDKVWD